MSQWTHICGCLRIVNLLGEPSKRQLEQRLGKQFGCGDEFPDAPEIPYGDEGSVRYSIIKNPNNSSPATWTVVIWGDLRDYSDSSEILEWLQNSTYGLMIRDCSVTVIVEGKEKTFISINDKNEIKEIKEITRIVN